VGIMVMGYHSQREFQPQGISNSLCPSINNTWSTHIKEVMAPSHFRISPRAVIIALRLNVESLCARNCRPPGARTPILQQTVMT
jgi:hypothetical protein